MEKKSIFIVMGIITVVIVGYYFINNNFNVNEVILNNQEGVIEDELPVITEEQKSNIKQEKVVIQPKSSQKDKLQDAWNQLWDYSEICSPSGIADTNRKLFPVSYYSGTKIVEAGSPTSITIDNHTITILSNKVLPGTKIHYCTVPSKVKLPLIGPAIGLSIEGYDESNEITLSMRSTGIPIDSDEDIKFAYDLVQFKHLKSGKEMMLFGWSQPKNGISEKMFMYEPGNIMTLMHIGKGLPQTIEGYIEMPS